MRVGERAWGGPGWLNYRNTEDKRPCWRMSSTVSLKQQEAALKPILMFRECSFLVCTRVGKDQDACAVSRAGETLWRENLTVAASI